MAHMIDMTNGRENMAYVGRKPWHGLGQELTPGADLEIWAREAGLDWTAETSPAWFLPAGADEHAEIPNTTVIHRSDNSAVLGVMSSRYQILQPRDALGFFDEFLKAGDLEMETAGSLDGGRRIWALARVGEDLVIKGQDQVQGFLLVATSFDGSMATTAKFTTVRVVCQNTLHMADWHDHQPTVRIPHSTAFDAEVVKAELGLKKRAWEDFGDVVVALADRKVDKFEARRWLIDVFGDPSLPIEKQSEADAKVMQKVWNAVEGGQGQNLRSTAGTAWGLVNGVTYFEDHQRRFRNDNNRLASGWFGESADRKQRALSAALKLVA